MRCALYLEKCLLISLSSVTLFKYMDTFSREANLTVSFLSPISVEVNFQRKGFAPREQILSFKRRLYFDRYDLCRGASRMSRELFTFIKWRKIMKVNQYTLRYSFNEDESSLGTKANWIEVVLFIIR